MATFPRSMGANKLYIKKGDRNSPLDYTGVLATGEAAKAGIAMSINGAGKLVAGLTASSLPFFAMSGTDINNAPDVVRERGMPYAGEGRFGTLCGLMSCELSTTGFDATAAYPVGTLLTAVAVAAVDPTIRGVLRPTALATDIVVGVVSADAVGSEDGYPTLSFYPRFIPGTTVPASLA